EVQAVAGADLDHPAAQPRQQLLAVGGHARLHRLAEPGEAAGEPGVVRRAAAAARGHQSGSLAPIGSLPATSQVVDRRTAPPPVPTASRRARPGARGILPPPSYRRRPPAATREARGACLRGAERPGCPLLVGMPAPAAVG